jgi:5-methylcytosine-specific restriction endonuclease McrA
MFILNGKKKCSKCGNEKHISEMGTRKGRVSHSWCKDCLAEARRERYAKDPESQREASRKWRRGHPDKAVAAARKWDAEHPEKVKEHDKKAYQKFADKIKERVKQWRKAHPDKHNQHNRNRRALKRVDGENITTEQWHALCDKYGNRCLCCGKKNVKLTQDHVIPLDLGGRHAIENLQPLCVSCNSSKGTRIMDYR